MNQRNDKRRSELYIHYDTELNNVIRTTRLFFHTVFKKVVAPADIIHGVKHISCAKHDTECSYFHDTATNINRRLTALNDQFYRVKSERDVRSFIHDAVQMLLIVKEVKMYIYKVISRAKDTTERHTKTKGDKRGGGEDDLTKVITEYEENSKKQFAELERLLNNLTRFRGRIFKENPVDELTPTGVKIEKRPPPYMTLETGLYIWYVLHFIQFHVESKGVDTYFSIYNIIRHYASPENLKNIDTIIDSNWNEDNKSMIQKILSIDVEQTDRPKLSDVKIDDFFFMIDMKSLSSIKKSFIQKKEGTMELKVDSTLDEYAKEIQRSLHFKTRNDKPTSSKYISDKLKNINLFGFSNETNGYEFTSNVQEHNAYKTIFEKHVCETIKNYIYIVQALENRTIRVLKSLKIDQLESLPKFNIFRIGQFSIRFPEGHSLFKSIIGLSYVDVRKLFNNCFKKNSEDKYYKNIIKNIVTDAFEGKNAVVYSSDTDINDTSVQSIFGDGFEVVREGNVLTKLDELKPSSTTFEEEGKPSSTTSEEKGMYINTNFLVILAKHIFDKKKKIKQLIDAESSEERFEKESMVEIILADIFNIIVTNIEHALNSYAMVQFFTENLNKGIIEWMNKMSEENVDVLTFLKIRANFNHEPNEVQTQVGNGKYRITDYNRRFDIRLNTNIQSYQYDTIQESDSLNILYLGYNNTKKPLYVSNTENVDIAVFKDKEKQIKLFGLTAVPKTNEYRYTYFEKPLTNPQNVQGGNLHVKYKRNTFRGGATQSEPSEQSKPSVSDTTTYNNTYVFGRFNKIFTPIYTNSQMTTTILSKIEKHMTVGKPIFMIGYGASGAGKTSSLIYYKKGIDSNSQNGVLMHICNEIYGKHGYNTINVYTEEFYIANTGGDRDDYDRITDEMLNNPTVKRVPADKDKTMIFKYDTGKKGFYLDKNNDDLHLPHIHQYRFQTGENHPSYKEYFVKNRLPEDKSAPTIDYTKNTTHTFTKGSATLGEVLLHVIDTDRFVKATTNNPNSSRSHVLVYLSMTKSGVMTDTENPINIIVGDFAGVENKFNCGDPSVIDAFMNVKRDDDSNIPYYTLESIGGNLDPIDVIQNTDSTRRDDCNDYVFFTQTLPNLNILDNNERVTENSIADEFFNELNEKRKSEYNTILQNFDTRSELENAYPYAYVNKSCEILNMMKKIHEKTITLNQLNYSGGATQTQTSSRNSLRQRKENVQTILDIKNIDIDLIQDLKDTVSSYGSLVNEKVTHFTSEKVIQVVKEKQGQNAKILTKEEYTRIQEANKYSSLGYYITNNKLNVDKILNESGAIKEGIYIGNFNCEYDSNAVQSSKRLKQDDPLLLSIYENDKITHVGEEFPHRFKEITNSIIVKLSSKMKELFDITFVFDEFDVSKFNSTKDKVAYVEQYIPKAKSYIIIKKFNSHGNIPEKFQNTVVRLNKSLPNVCYKGSQESMAKHILTQMIEKYKSAITHIIDTVSKQTTSITISGDTTNHIQIEIYELYSKLSDSDKNSCALFILKDNKVTPLTVEHIKKTYFNIDIDPKPQQNEKTEIDNIPSLAIESITLNKSPVRELYIELHKKLRFSSNQSDFESRKNAILNYIDTYIQVIDLYTHLIREVQCRTGDSTVICKNRTIEGKFINDSLSKMRDIIVDIIYERKKDVINFSPNYVDACLTEYCPSKTGCFELPKKRESDPNKINSVIFSHIYEFLKNQKKTGQEYKITDFYKDIIISVFCVFSASHSANNPPPVPYVDINKIRHSIYYGELWRYLKDKDIESVMSGIKKYIEYVYDINLKGEFTSTTVDEQIKSKTDIISGLYDKEKLYNFIKEMKEFKDKYSQAFTSPVDVNKAEEDMQLWYVNSVKPPAVEFIKMVENVNSISAVGTLEYIDKIAKFNTTETICEICENNDNTGKFDREMEVMDLVAIDEKISDAN